MKQYQDKNKSLEEINKEIEEQLLYEMENNKEEEETKKSKRAIYSISGLLMLVILGRLIYHIVQLYL